MDWKNNKVLLVIVIIGNLVLWPVLIIPKVPGALAALGDVIPFFKIFQGPVDETIKSKDSTQNRMENTNFLAMRDPFISTSGKNRYQAIYHRETAQNTTRQDNGSTSSTSTVQQRNDVVQRTYTSRFKLKTIVQLKEKYMAGLEEQGTYDQSTDNNPYSYRFNGGNPDQGGQAAPKNYMVMEGDTVMDETVVKIAEEFVIMRKNGLFYKLTFTGGFAVNGPD